MNFFYVRIAGDSTIRLEDIPTEHFERREALETFLKFRLGYIEIGHFHGISVFIEDSGKRCTMTLMRSVNVTMETF